MKIRRFVGGNLAANGYVIYQKDGGRCYVIDPGYNPKKFIAYIKEHQLEALGILLTHLHYDHTDGAEAISRALDDCPILMHEADAFVYKGRVDTYLKDGDRLELDGEELQIIHTPGHTKGGICIMAAKSRVCFTGDTLFDTDLGRSDLAGGSEADMKDTVCRILDSWENDIVIYPGHEDGCTMKKVRRYNTEFLALLAGKER